MEGAAKGTWAVPDSAVLFFDTFLTILLLPIHFLSISCLSISVSSNPVYLLPLASALIFHCLLLLSVLQLHWRIVCFMVVEKCLSNDFWICQFSITLMVINTFFFVYKKCPSLLKKSHPCTLQSHLCRQISVPAYSKAVSKKIAITLWAYTALNVFIFIFLSSFIMTEASIMSDLNFFETRSCKIKILCEVMTS